MNLNSCRVDSLQYLAEAKKSVQSSSHFFSPELSPCQFPADQAAHGETAQFKQHGEVGYNCTRGKIAYKTLFMEHKEKLETLNAAAVVTKNQKNAARNLRLTFKSFEPV